MPEQGGRVRACAVVKGFGRAGCPPAVRGPADSSNIRQSTARQRWNLVRVEIISTSRSVFTLSPLVRRATRRYYTHYSVAGGRVNVTEARKPPRRVGIRWPRGAGRR